MNEEMREAIALAAVQAAEETASRLSADGIGGRVNYYRIMERLLRNYKRLEKLCKNEADYLRVEVQGRSKSLVKFSPNASSKGFDEIEEELEREKARNYARTKANFREVERVVELFRERKEFVVVRMYYFGEDADGGETGRDQVTWEEIADELAARGVLKDAKTARRWRAKIIDDMAVCMFGRAAAVAGGLHEAQMQ